MEMSGNVSRHRNRIDRMHLRPRQRFSPVSRMEVAGTGSLFLLSGVFWSVSFHRGLLCSDGKLVWFGMVAALAIRGFGHLLLLNHWSRGVSHHDLNAFRNTIGPERYIFLA